MFHSIVYCVTRTENIKKQIKLISSKEFEQALQEYNYKGYTKNILCFGTAQLKAETYLVNRQTVDIADSVTSANSV